MPPARGGADRGRGRGRPVLPHAAPSAYVKRGRSRGGGRPRGGRGRGRDAHVETQPDMHMVALSNERSLFKEQAVLVLKTKWSIFEQSNPHWFMANSQIPNAHWKGLMLALRESAVGMPPVPSNPITPIDKTQALFLSRATFSSKHENVARIGHTAGVHDRRLSEFAFVGLHDEIVTRHIFEAWGGGRDACDQLAAFDGNAEDETPLLSNRTQHAPNSAIGRHTVPLVKRARLALEPHHCWLLQTLLTAQLRPRLPMQHSRRNSLRLSCQTLASNCSRHRGFRV